MSGGVMRTSQTILALLTLAVIGCDSRPPTNPSGPPTPPAAPPPPATRNVTGTVRDDRGDPIVGATITSSGVIQDMAESDAGGRFVVKVNAASLAYIGGTKAGYEPDGQYTSGTT